LDKNPRANRSQKIDGGEQFFSRANDFDTQKILGDFANLG
jgi:hypothetical protein